MIEVRPSIVIPTIRNRIICITGFRQHEYEMTGLERIWMALRTNENPETRVSIVEWDTNWKYFARHILRTGPKDITEFDVRVIAYSWGCGYGFLELAELLGYEGVKITKAALCDPVYYSRNGAIWRAVASPVLNRIVGPPKVVLPYNVEYCEYVRQRNSLPSGHEVVTKKNSSTKVKDMGWLDDYDHISIDNSSEFWDMATRTVQGLS